MIILFDMDGTLVDTEDLAARAGLECFSRWNPTRPLSKADSDAVIGRTWTAALATLFARYPLPSHLSREAATAEILATYRALLNAATLEELEVRGAARAVGALRAMPDAHLALVSGSFRADIEWNLKKLGIRQHFDAVFGAEDVFESKPSPEGFLKAVEWIRAERRASPHAPVVIFEDSPAGIQAAFAALATHVVHVGKEPLLPEFRARVSASLSDLSVVDAQWIRKLTEKA